MKVLVPGTASLNAEAMWRLPLGSWLPTTPPPKVSVSTGCSSVQLGN